MLTLFLLTYLAVGLFVVVVSFISDVSGVGPGNAYIRLLNSWVIGNTFLTVALTAVAVVLWPLHLAIFFAAK